MAAELISGCSYSGFEELLFCCFAFVSSKVPFFRLVSASAFPVTCFLEISSDPVDLLLCESDISKNGPETLCVNLWIFCRATRWAPELFRGGPHISIVPGRFSLCFFRDISTSEHTQGCYQPMQSPHAVSKGHSL